MDARCFGSALALCGLLFVACHGRETDEVLARLRADNAALRDEITALRAENAVLIDAGHEPQWPRTVSLQRIGGAEGRLMYRRACPVGQALKGFVARAGSVIDSLVAVCAPVDDVTGGAGGDGHMTTTTSFERELAIIGGRGGRAGDSLCPGRALMTGLRGRGAEVVDAIEVVCQNEQRGRRIGGGGGRESERLCPPGWLAVGITGRHGEYVESISVMCAQGPEPRDAPEAP